MRGTLWQVVAVALLLGVVVVGANPTTERATTAVNETDTVTVQHEGVVRPMPDNRTILYYDNETVTVDNGTTTLVEGVDYEWFPRNGSVSFNASGQTTEGESANITYVYGTGSETTGIVATTLGAVGQWYGLLLLLFGLGAVWLVSAGPSGGF